MNDTKIPAFVAPFLWSYDLDKLDLVKDKHIIIHNVLNLGAKQATDWLRSVYTKEEIQHVLTTTPKSAWQKSSLALWSLIFEASPKKSTRFT